MKKLQIIWVVLAMVLWGVGDVRAQIVPLSDGFQMPFDGNPALSCEALVYGECFHSDQYHLAEDYDLSVGSPVYASANGVVRRANQSTGYGGLVLIEHRLVTDEHVVSLYAHMLTSTLQVMLGEEVVRGQLIGYVADRWDNGGNYDPHLHFGIHKWSFESTPTYACNGGWAYQGYSANSCVLSDWYDPSNFVDSHAPAPSQVGYFADGWHDDGISQQFLDKYNELLAQGHDLGDPWDNGPGDQWVHYQNGMYIQDFLGYSNGYNLPYTALVRKAGLGESVNLLKDAFWDLWMNNAGWVNFGAATSDEYQIGSNVRQDFDDGTDYYYFIWNGNPPAIAYHAGGQLVDMSEIVVENPSQSRTSSESDGVYHGTQRVADFGQSFQLINNRSYNGFFAVVDNQEVPITSFDVNGDMTIYLDQVSSEVINLNITPDTPQPGQYFQVNVLVSESPGVTVSRFRVVLQTIGGSVLQTMYNANDFNLSYGFDGNYSIQYGAIGIYKIGVQYSLDNGSTWDYFDSSADTDNPLIFDIMSPPVASFSRNPSSGTEPLNVQFTDQSSNNPSAWYWSFGDGSHSTYQNPNHTYSSAGSFNVSLTASNAAGGDTETWNACVTVDPAGQAPVASFTSDVTSGPAPLTVHFTDQSTNNPTSWEWNFTDGGMSTEQNPIHVYQTPGTYSVYLSVVNAYGADAVWQMDYIHVQGDPLESNFTADVTSGPSPLTVNFTDLSTGNPTLWSWNFGDGIHSNLQNPSHTYESVGVYNASLWVEDGVTGDELNRPQYITVTDEGGCLGDGAYGFDGQSSYLSFSPYNPGVSDFTIEGWVNIHSLSPHAIIFFEEQSGATGRPGIKCNAAQDGRIHFVVAEPGNSGENDHDMYSLSSVEENAWTYVACSRENGLYKIYINGQLDNSVDYGANNPVSEVTSQAYLGHRYNSTYPNAQYYLDGQVDEWRVSNIARSAEEIAEHYYNREEFISDEYTVALWHMNGSLGTVNKRENAQGNNTMELIEHSNPDLAYGFNECFTLDLPQLSITYLDQEIVLDWSDISGANSYQVYGANNGGGYALLASPTESQQTFSGSMLDPGNVWLFYVTAVSE
jgi:PKD repeat protein